jgi:hypothetical protein
MVANIEPFVVFAKGTAKAGPYQGEEVDIPIGIVLSENRFDAGIEAKHRWPMFVLKAKPWATEPPKMRMFALKMDRGDEFVQ